MFGLLANKLCLTTLHLAVFQKSVNATNYVSDTRYDFNDKKEDKAIPNKKTNKQKTKTKQNRTKQNKRKVR